MASKFQIQKSSDGQFRFNLKASNGEIILTSELYKQKASALGGVDSVKKNALLDERYDRRKAKDGSPYFVLTAGNKEIVGKSEMYSSAAAMENGIASVKKNAPTATVEDLAGS